MQIKDVECRVEDSVDAELKPVDQDSVITIETGEDFKNLISWLLGQELPKDVQGVQKMRVAVGMSFNQYSEPASVIIHSDHRTYSLSPIAATATILSIPDLAIKVEEQASGAGEMLIAFGKCIADVLIEMAQMSAAATRH
jgi:hypothetical protein